ncbi:MAG: hypothetical protein J0L67_12575 [Cytophagales bacterium]|nr:hypothetical protein [Cytophagales bacterium]
MSNDIVGKFFQSEKIANHKENETKILNNIFFEKIEFEPIVPKAILHKKAKVTDLISNVNAGGNLHLLMSKKLADIVRKHRKNGMQFFETSLITHDNKEIRGYLSLNMFVSNNEYIDIKNSIVRYDKKSEDYNLTYKTKVEYTYFNDQTSFDEALQFATQNHETFYFSKIRLLNNIDEEFFMLRYVEGGAKYVVSEKLKKEIEDAGCTGIEFQPVDLSLTEWLQGGEREKIYGKA